MVRNAGHILPYDQPKWAFDMIQRFIQDKEFWTALFFLFNFIYHVSTKLIHNGIKIMICYKQYQWQFNEAMYNVSKVPMVNLHLKCLMKFSTSYNQIIFLKTHFDLSTFLNVNKYTT